MREEGIKEIAIEAIQTCFNRMSTMTCEKIGVMTSIKEITGWRTGDSKMTTILYLYRILFNHKLKSQCHAHSSHLLLVAASATDAAIFTQTIVGMRRGEEVEEITIQGLYLKISHAHPISDDAPYFSLIF